MSFRHRIKPSSQHPAIGRRWRAHFPLAILAVQGPDSCVTVAQKHGGLRSWHHGGVCALPLLTGNSAAAARKVIKVRTKNLPPQPSTTTHHALPPWEPSPTLAEGSQGGPSSARGLSACLSVLSTILHAQHSDQSSNPKQSPCPELRETEKESLFHVKQRTKPSTK